MNQLKLSGMSTEERIALLHFAYPALFRDQISPEALERLRLDFLEDRLIQIEEAYQNSDKAIVESYMSELLSEVKALADNPLLPGYIAALVGSYEGGIDGLTRLRNQGLYKSDLEREVARAARENGKVSLALIDVDHFKTINDARGHPFGDKVLKGVADSITRPIRKSDAAYRFGGDEFAVILPDANEDDALDAAKRILDGAHNLMIDNEAYPVGLSIGLAQLIPGESAPEFNGRADSVLYRAKDEGRNRLAASTESCPVCYEH